MSDLSLFLKNPKQVLIELDKFECVKFATFVKRAWPILEPTTPLVWGKILDVMCDELEALVKFEAVQPRKLANVPPGTMKSLLWSVMFPAWVWGPAGMPEKSFTGASHEQTLAIRDARKMRLLIESDWYQARWPLAMARDQNAKTSFENEKRGFRQAVPFRSMTGRRSDFVIIDDPLSAEDGNSQAARDEAIRIFRETLPTRVNSDKSAILMIMQRLHEEDPSGFILSEADRFGYDTLIFPMRFDPERADPKDWRREPGELLFPERFSEQAVSQLERMLGSYGASGQLQQSPVPREGGMFKYDWFDGKILDKAPDGCDWVRGWDFAGSADKNADATAGVKIGRAPDGRIIVADVRNERLESPGVKRLVRQVAEMDGREVVIDIPQDPGSAGKSVRIEYVSHLAGYTVKWGSETGDKETRAQPFQTQCENGNVYLVRGDWIQPYLNELCNFPGAKHDDMVDASSRAFNRLASMKPKKTTFVAPKIMTA